MKKFLIYATAALSLTLAACSKQDAETPVPVQKELPAEEKPQEPPRPAAYNPNLKPGQVVWDSPEKQKAWEAKKAELKKKASAQKQ